MKRCPVAACPRRKRTANTKHKIVHKHKHKTNINPRNTMSIKDYVSNRLKDLLQDHCNELPSLQPFCSDSESPSCFAPFLKDTFIPSVPTRPQIPLVLLHGLQEQKVKDTDAYAYIDKCRKKGPAVLYGTSGAGKTRSIFEYLSHNVGVYLLSNTSGRDPGSDDLRAIFAMKLDRSDALAPRFNKDKEHEVVLRNYKNRDTISDRLQILLHVRMAVYNYMKSELEKKNLIFTPHHWLLVQLFPEEIFGSDIFFDLTSEACVLHEDENYKLPRSVTAFWSSIFVDETQQLLNKGGQYFRNEAGTERQSEFSALLEAFIKVRLSHQIKGYPVFSGTGLSIHVLDKEANSASATAKNKLKPYEKSFIGFQQLTCRDVIQYLEIFLDLSSVDDDVVTHVGKWLRGRPRFTATFFESFIVQDFKAEYTKGTMGDFTGNTEQFIQALDRFVAGMSLDKASNRRTSWVETHPTAYAAIERVVDENDYELRRDLENAFFKYAIEGVAVLLSSRTKVLIHTGVAALDISNSKPDILEFAAKIDEPLMIQAGIRFFGLQRVLERYLHESPKDGYDECFERVMLPGIQQKLQDLLVKQFPDDDFAGYFVSSRSSYGVLASVSGADDVAATVKWMQDAAGAKFEGLVPPFCYPDKHFGPDLVFLLWDMQYKKYRIVISQAKFRKESDQARAMRTLVPEWLFHKKHGDPVKRGVGSIAKKVHPEWASTSVAKKLTTESCVRLLVQYPANMNHDASPAQAFHKDSWKPCVESKSKSKSDSESLCDKTHDWLYTIGGQNGGELFGPRTLAVLNHLKDEPKKKKARIVKGNTSES